MADEAAAETQWAELGTDTLQYVGISELSDARKNQLGIQELSDDKKNELGIKALSDDKKNELDIKELDGQGLAELGIQRIDGGRASDAVAAVAPSGGLGLPASPWSGGAQIGALTAKLNELARDQAAASEAPSSAADSLATLGGESEEKIDPVIEDAWKLRSAKSRTAIASKYDRFKKKSEEEQKKYKAAVGHTGKENCILEWVDSQYDAWSEKRQKLKTNSEAHLEWGAHEPFEVICGKESGVGITESGAMAALNIALACQKLGHPWVKWNGFSKRAEYLYCKSGFKNKFETAWIEYKNSTGASDDLAQEFLAEVGNGREKRRKLGPKISEESAGTKRENEIARKEAAVKAKEDELQAKSEAADKAAAEKAAKTDAKEKLKEAAAAKRAAAAAGSGRQPAPRGGKRALAEASQAEEAKDPKKIKKDARKALGEFKTLISSYGQALTSGKMIITNIEIKDKSGLAKAWEFAEDTKVNGSLYAAIDDLENASIGNPILQKLVTQKVDQVKSDLGDKFFTHMESISELVQPKIAKIEKEVETMVSMHALMLQKLQTA